MGFHVVIPARYASTRLPGKPLADIGGRPMVVRVVDAASRSAATDVTVATDDARVRDAVSAHGHRAVMTRMDHPSGTDRIAEVAERMGWADGDIVVNVQGDEPLIDPRLVDAVASALEGDPGAAIATAAANAVLTFVPTGEALTALLLGLFVMGPLVVLARPDPLEKAALRSPAPAFRTR